MGTIAQRFQKNYVIYEEGIGKEYAREDYLFLPVAVIENTTEAADEYLKSDKSGSCGDQLVTLTPQDIQALQDGKAIAISPQTEYDVFIILKQ